MGQLPNVRMKLHPSSFDLLMSILEDNAENRANEEIRSAARDLVEKRMRFTRLYPGDTGNFYASVRMYETEAAEMIWQLLYACADHYTVREEYSKRLAGGDENV